MSLLMFFLLFSAPQRLRENCFFIPICAMLFSMNNRNVILTSATVSNLVRLNSLWCIGYHLTAPNPAKACQTLGVFEYIRRLLKLLKGSHSM